MQTMGEHRARTIICAAVLVIAALGLAAIGTYPFLFLDT
jgi:hypothetical protein